ncbi:hypothetical protein Ancab_036045 [Ancistrocladus abbreviatus]
MPDVGISLEKVKQFWHSQVHDPEKWAMNTAGMASPTYAIELSDINVVHVMRNLTNLAGFCKIKAIASCRALCWFYLFDAQFWRVHGNMKNGWWTLGLHYV